MNLLVGTKYVTKADLRNATGIDASKLAAKSDLASLKAKVDKTDVEKLKTVPNDLSKLSNIVNNKVLKKCAYDELRSHQKELAAQMFLLTLI